MKEICRQRESDEMNHKQATRRGDQKKECVAQSSRRVKDKRLRRACGILDPSRCQCYEAIKGLYQNDMKRSI
jgi:hypothetical protein